MKVIVTGSLGHISKPLTEELVKKGHAVTVISSSLEKQKDIEALGASAAIGSLEKTDFLVSAFTDADAVYLMIPPNFNELDQIAYYRRIGNNYAKAIKESGVKRVVHLSSYGADLDKGTGFILGSHNVEKILNELENINLTHLRPGYFYYNLYSFTDMIKNLGFIGSVYGGDDKLIMVAPDDIANVAAEEIDNPSSNKVRYIVSEELTANEAAKVLGEAIGKAYLKWITVSEEQMKDGLKSNGMPDPLVEKFVEMATAIHTGIMLKDYEQNKPSTFGKVKLKDFAKEFFTAFKNQI